MALEVRVTACTKAEKLALRFHPGTPLRRSVALGAALARNPDRSLATG